MCKKKKRAEKYFALVFCGVEASFSLLPHYAEWNTPLYNVTELMINKKAWESLPADLQAIVRSCAQACNLDSHAWSEANNADALTDLVTNEGVIAQTLPDDVVMQLKTLTEEVLAEKSASDPLTKKVHDHFMAFRDKHRSWASISEKPYHGLISS